MPDRLDPTNPRSGREEGLWVQSWALPTGRGYGVRVNVDARSWTLGRDRAIAYATTLVQRATEAEHDAAVFRLFTERLGVPAKESAETLHLSIREQRAADHSATEPLELTAGVTLDEAVGAAPAVRPFIAMHLDGAQVGQLTPADARDHAIAVLGTIAAADLDSALRRALVGSIGIDEARASAVIASLSEYWPTEEAPRRVR